MGLFRYWERWPLHAGGPDTLSQVGEIKFGEQEMSANRRRTNASLVGQIKMFRCVGSNTFARSK